MITSIEQIAKTCHEVNKAFCQAMGDDSQLSWEDAPIWQKDSAITGVKFHIAHPDSKPCDSHNSWLAQKVKEGWVYGEIKNPDKREHPCMVPFEELPKEQQMKDHLFIAVVRSFESNTRGMMFNFGQVIEALKLGKRATRKGWNGKHMFVFMRPADELHIDMVIDKVKSLPQSVKDYYREDVLDDNGDRIYPADDSDKVTFTAYLCLKDSNGKIQNGWLATQTDMLSEDWIILD